LTFKKTKDPILWSFIPNSWSIALFIFNRKLLPIFLEEWLFGFLYFYCRKTKENKIIIFTEKHCLRKIEIESIKTCCCSSRPKSKLERKKRNKVKLTRFWLTDIHILRNWGHSFIGTRSSNQVLECLILLQLFLLHHYHSTKWLLPQKKIFLGRISSRQINFW